jgi:hypothetical protein
MSKVPRQSASGGIDSTGNATSGGSSAARPRQHPPHRPREAPPRLPPLPARPCCRPVTPLSARDVRGRKLNKTIERTKMNPIKKNHDAALRTGAMALAAAGASTVAHAATVQITFNNSFVSTSSGIATLDTDFGGDGVRDVYGQVNTFGVRVYDAGLTNGSGYAVEHGAAGWRAVNVNGGVLGRLAGVDAFGSNVAIQTGMVAFSLVDSAVRGGALTVGWLDMTATGRATGERGRVDVHRFVFDDTAGLAPGGVAHADAAYPEYSAVAVPEPSGIVLLALGAGGLLARRRRAMAA